jgi:hypothetical protein
VLTLDPRTVAGRCFLERLARERELADIRRHFVADPAAVSLVLVDWLLVEVQRPNESERFFGRSVELLRRDGSR